MEGHTEVLGSVSVRSNGLQIGVGLHGSPMILWKVPRDACEICTGVSHGCHKFCFSERGRNKTHVRIRWKTPTNVTGRTWQV